jgi:phospholipase A1
MKDKKTDKQVSAFMKKTLTLARSLAPALIFSFLILVAKLPKALAYEDEVKPSLEIFSGYKPMFFLFGTEHSKFQISFKAKIIESVPIYFGYQQTSFWDLFKDSAPFTDTSYAPDLFYRQTLNSDRKTWLDYGAMHESNGKDGIQSRAWNRFFLRYTTNENWSFSNLNWSVQAWYPITSHDVSRDLLRYRGLYELSVTWSDFLGQSFDRDDLTLRLYPGGNLWINPLLGGQELTLRLKGKERKFLPLFLVQLFHGYGESLLDFQDTKWILRIGVGF